MRTTGTTILVLLSAVLLAQICVTHGINDEPSAEPVLSETSSSRSARLRLIKSKPTSNDAHLNADGHKVFDLDGNDLDATDNVDSEGEPTSKPITPKVSKDQLLPIVLIPGLEGSRLTATLNKPTSSHYYCQKKAKVPFTIWVINNY